MGLFLDTAYFPGVDAATNAARSVGADGWAGYIFDPYLPNGNGGWTPDAVNGLLANGLGFLPIYVPGNSPLTASRCIQVLQSYGFNNGPCVIDIESGSDPGQAYVEQWCDVLKGAGYFAIVYGTESTVAADANHANGIWVANYIYQSIQPNLGPFPPGFSTTWFANARAWQYANSFNVAGVDVDASTSNLPLDYIAGKGGGTVTVLGPFNPAVSGTVIGNAQAYDWNTLSPAGTIPAGTKFAYVQSKNVDSVWYNLVPGGNWCIKDTDFNTFDANNPANTPDAVWAAQQAANTNPPPPVNPPPVNPPPVNPPVELQPLIDAVNAVKTSVDALNTKLDVLQHGIDAVNAVLVRMENGFKSV